MSEGILLQMQSCRKQQESSVNVPQYSGYLEVQAKATCKKEQLLQYVLAGREGRGGGVLGDFISFLSLSRSSLLWQEHSTVSTWLPSKGVKCYSLCNWECSVTHKSFTHTVCTMSEQLNAYGIISLVLAFLRVAHFYFGAHFLFLFPHNNKLPYTAI